MSNVNLEILTPKNQFFNEPVEAVTVMLPDGELTVLPGHAPMIAALDLGNIRIKRNGTWRSVFLRDGFMEVRPDEVLIFTQMCVWEDELDFAHEQEDLEHRLERFRHEQNVHEHNQNIILLKRALVHLSKMR